MFCSGYPKDFTRTRVEDNAFDAEWEECERRECEINMSNLHTLSNLLTDMIVQNATMKGANISPLMAKTLQSY